MLKDVFNYCCLLIVLAVILGAIAWFAIGRH